MSVVRRSLRKKKKVFSKKKNEFSKKNELCYRILEREEECSEISKNDNDNIYYCNILVRRSSRKRKNLTKFPMAKL